MVVLYNADDKGKKVDEMVTLEVNASLQQRDTDGQVQNIGGDVQSFCQTATDGDLHAIYPLMCQHGIFSNISISIISISHKFI